MKDVVISLCDLSGSMVMPWVQAGYHAILVDPQHPQGVSVEHLTSGGSITRVGHIVDHPTTFRVIRDVLHRVVRVFGFPVCTDLAVSGSKHFETKRLADPSFQAKAMQLVHECRIIGEMTGAPWFFENPISMISSIYRQPDYIFSPHEYGGYLPEDDVHPLYPEYFPPRDAYGKKTCLWVGNGFEMPRRRPVKILEDQQNGKGGNSKSYSMLGGKSERTKNIRSSTPRGFALAVFKDYDEL